MVGKTVKLTVTMENAANSQIVWTSSGEKIATVTPDELVTGVKKGSCQLTATAQDGSKVKAQITVTVKEYDVVITSPEGATVAFETQNSSYGTMMQIGRYVIRDMVDTIVKFKNGNVRGEKGNLMLPVAVGEDQEDGIDVCQ